MREIKFRAWDAKNKKFPKTFIGFHVTGECSAFDLLKQYSLEEFCELEIQQFTGSKDDKKVDIYEGDIVRLNAKEAYQADYEVIWDKCGFSLISAGRDGDDFGVYTANLKMLGRDTIVVIGNIFENPRR